MNPFRTVVSAVALAVPVLLGACGGGAADDAGGEAGLQIVVVSFPTTGTTTAPYSATMRAQGGAGDYVWDVVAGVLPDGLAGVPAFGDRLDLAGTPAVAGAYVFTVELRDVTGASTASQFALTISDGGGGGGGGTNRATSMTNAPTGRAGHTAVWTGAEMIVWGGFAQIGLFNTGGAYDPATDTWRALSTTGAPSGRQGHTAVWTGTEMVVFGGWDITGALLNTGGAYNPATDAWRALPLTNAPQVRATHTAVWAGNAMWVWGGVGMFVGPPPNSVVRILNDGASYDPTLDTWTPLPTGPALRQHAAVWTGTGMTAWGGLDGSAISLTPVNSGGIYDTVNGWRNTNGSAPAARFAHTAVAAGTNTVVVWGGSTNGVAHLNSGGRLNTFTNTWQATSTSGAASSRIAHTAVFTGTEMVIWGGRAGAALLNDGGVYRPASDTWRPLAPGFQPSGRSGHTAVWTGASMIVWGGNSAIPDVYHDSGAVLFP